MATSDEFHTQPRRACHFTCGGDQTLSFIRSSIHLFGRQGIDEGEATTFELEPWLESEIITARASALYIRRLTAARAKPRPQPQP